MKGLFLFKYIIIASNYIFCHTTKLYKFVVIKLIKPTSITYKLQAELLISIILKITYFSFFHITQEKKYKYIQANICDHLHLHLDFGFLIIQANHNKIFVVLFNIML